MKIEMHSALTTDSKNKTLVQFASQSKTKSKNSKSNETETKVTLKGASKDLQSMLAAAIDDKTISGKHGECVLFRDFAGEGYRHLIVVGIGEESALTSDKARQLGASLQQCVAASKLSDVVINFDHLNLAKKAPAYLQAILEGALLSAYSFEELKSNKKDKANGCTLHFVMKAAKNREMQKAFSDAHIIGECVNFSRRLGDMPGNLMTPTVLADTVVAATKGTGIKATVWDKARIKKEKMGGLLGVANGSAEEPRFIILEYKGAAATKKPFVMVGKGLTFDTGGISIKPSASMEEMKYDMCGGANVVGALLAIAKMKLKINAMCIVPATENMPGSRATKPGDIHTARNGKTFEVNNTDAEGRLILSDALCYASEQNPQVIIDAATLTGAMLMALGNIHTGFFTNNKDLRKAVEATAEATGELVWNMPLVDHHTKDMKGTYADLSNVSSGKGAGSATAAAFLEQFVAEGIPWAHFDIAGTGWHTGSRVNYNPKKGASGVMIRTFVELAKSYV
jgi:leucyl aminopeptidase